MNALNRLFLKSAYRVTRYGSIGFNLHRRFLWFFYRPVSWSDGPVVFPGLPEVFDFIHDETGSHYASVELYPPGDFSTHLHAEVPFTGVTGSGLIPTTGPKYHSVITGARISPALDENRHAAVSPEGPDYGAVVVGALMAQAMMTPEPAEPTPSTDTPLERDDMSSAAHDSQSSAAYDSHDSGSSSCDCGSSDSGSSSCDSGSSSCDSGSSSCDSGSCGGGDCQ